MGHAQHQFGDYFLLGEIAAGGMGVVYQAVYRPLNRSCALKLIRNGLLATADERRRFETEAEAASALEHPGIIRIRQAGEMDGQWFLEMELVEGGTLADFISEGPFAPREAARILREVAVALQYAHSMGVLHRDLKPANILIGPAGKPKITDFGLARFLGRGSDLTRTFAVLGTPAYMAPELASGRARDATISADVYSLGIVLFECLTGKKPFKGASALEVLRSIAETTISRPSAINPAVPRDLDVITLRCLAYDPSSRFTTAGELADELTRFLGNEPIRSRPITLGERVSLWSRRHPHLAGVIAAGLAAALLASSLITRQWIRAESAVRSWKDANRVIGLTKSRLEDLLVSEILRDAAVLSLQGDSGGSMLRALRGLVDAPGNPRLLEWVSTRLAFDSFLVEEKSITHDQILNVASLDALSHRIVTGGKGGIRVFDLKGGLLTLIPTDEITSAWHEAGGNAFLTHDSSGELVLWNFDKGKPLRQSWKAADIICVALSPNRTSFVAANKKGNCWIGLMNGNVMPRLTADLSAAPNALAIRKDELSVAAALPTGELLVSSFTTNAWGIVSKSQRVSRIAFSSDGQFLVAASNNRMSRYRLSDGEEVYSREFGNLSQPFALSPNGNHAVFAEIDRRIQVLPMSGQSEIQRSITLPGPAEALDFSSDGDHLLVTTKNGKICIVTLHPFRVLATADQPTIPWSAEFDSGTGTLLTSGLDNQARLFRLTPRATNGIAVLPSGLIAATPLFGDRSLVALTTGGEVFRMDFADGETKSRLLGSVSKATALGVPNTRPSQTQTMAHEVLVGDSEGRVWAAATDASQHIREIFNLGKQVAFLNAASEGQRFAVASTNSVTLVDLSNGVPRVRLSHAFADIRTLVASVTGRHFAVGSYSGAVTLLDAESAKVLWTKTNHLGPTFGLAFSSDGKQIASASLDKTSCLWDVETGRDLIPTLENPTEAASIAYRPNDTKLAVGGDGLISLWDADSGKRSGEYLLPRNFDLPRRFASSVGFSPDGEMLAAADSIGNLMVWDVRTSTLLGDWTLSIPSVRGATRSRGAWLTGNLFAGWSFSGIVRFVEIPPRARPDLLIDLAEWVTSKTSDSNGAIVRLDQAAREERLKRLRTAAEGGELSPALRRHLPN